MSLDHLVLVEEHACLNDHVLFHGRAQSFQNVIDPRVGVDGGDAGMLQIGLRLGAEARVEHARGPPRRHIARDLDAP